MKATFEITQIKTDEGKIVTGYIVVAPNGPKTRPLARKAAIDVCKAYGWYYSNIIGYEKRLKRLESLRTQLRGECISYGELAELQSLVPFIDPSDIELLEAAGVPEHT